MHLTGFLFNDSGFQHLVAFREEAPFEKESNLN